MITKEKENIIFKVMIFFILFIVLSIAIILRIIMIQTYSYHKYKSFAMKNNFREATIKADRGNIYSSDNVLLATTIVRNHIFLDLKVIDQKIFDQHINELSDSLSLVFNKKKGIYKEILTQQKKKKINITYLLIMLTIISFVVLKNFLFSIEEKIKEVLLKNMNFFVYTLLTILVIDF